jgi:hypothetical protein
MDEDLINYFVTEQINIKQNNLNCIIPTKIGFFENTAVRGETFLDLYSERLKEIFPSNMPAFQLIIPCLWLNNGEKCKVVMLVCCSDDAK